MPENENQIRQYDPSKNGFILVDKYFQLVDALKSRATFINDLRPQDIDFVDITTAIKARKEAKEKRPVSQKDSALYEKYLGQDISCVSEKNKEVLSKLYSYLQILNKLKSESSEDSLFSYGIFAPTYLEELINYKNATNNSGDHKSLLIGALTTDTAQEYTGIVKSVFNKAETSIIDIDNHLKSVPGFQTMNGLETSFQDNIFDTVHTNFLLYQLHNESFENYKKESEDRDNNFNKFFKEQYRILKPGGKLIMVEGNLYEMLETTDINLIFKKLSESISDAGFKNIKIKPPKQFTNSRDLFAFTRSSAGNQDIIDKKGTETFIDFVITATK